MRKLYQKDWDNKINLPKHMIPTNGGRIVNLKTGVSRDRIMSDLFIYQTNAGLLNIKSTDFAPTKKFLMDLCSDNKEYFEYKSILYGYFLTSTKTNTMI